MDRPTTIDKSGWGPGPWQEEPDKVEWTTLGFPCLITRIPRLGHLCGYLAVPPGHPWHGKSYNDEGWDPEVHGGLTYAAKCSEFVCHVPAAGESDDVWWLGFDCAHSWDVSPGLEANYVRLGLGFSLSECPTVYRTVEYVRAQVEDLARQAEEAARG